MFAISIVLIILHVTAHFRQDIQFTNYAQIHFSSQFHLSKVIMPT